MARPHLRTVLQENDGVGDGAFEVDLRRRERRGPRVGEKVCERSIEPLGLAKHDINEAPGLLVDLDLA